VKTFLKKTFPDRGGYIRKQDREKVVILWKRGEDPRFELVEKQSGKVIKSVDLASYSGGDIEKLLEENGFEPMTKR